MREMLSRINNKVKGSKVHTYAGSICALSHWIRSPNRTVIECVPLEMLHSVTHHLGENVQLCKSGTDRIPMCLEGFVFEVVPRS